MIVGKLKVEIGNTAEISRKIDEVFKKCKGDVAEVTSEMSWRKCEGCDFFVYAVTYGDVEYICRITGQVLTLTECVKDKPSTQNTGGETPCQKA